MTTSATRPTAAQPIRRFMRRAIATLSLSCVTGGLFMAPVLAQPPAVGRTEPANTPQTLADGVYLYGQSQQPDQLGSAYLVFEVEQQQAVGAFYMPHSSFDCFSGQVRPNRLDLSVVSSYEQTVHSYSVAIETPATLVAGPAASEFTLVGFHSLQPDAQDYDILATCQADFAQR
ncbi:hypothetical protein IQ241_09380 [Romeria aff. gracilis LEGE 07310]|uniref:Uncharacterized protein n=1 Tax=Vasconcelosia minhoensis LEGE 07310 TaxID=915328 RepID=A0A8J7A6D0_9CYAN|nr:hypothetical protein [Romeria aff. gracilis LEGE 07310]